MPKKTKTVNRLMRKTTVEEVVRSCRYLARISVRFVHTVNVVPYCTYSMCSKEEIVVAAVVGREEVVESNRT